MAREKQQLPSGFYRTTFMIGIGFFTMGLMDPLYDNYVPVFLNGFVASRALIGSLMTIDNIMAVLLPLSAASVLGALSRAPRIAAYWFLLRVGVRLLV